MREPCVAHRLLATDYYELTMAKGYLDSGMEAEVATFDLFIRSLPEGWGFFIACGIEDAVDFLCEDFFFRPEDISYIEDLGFPKYLLDFCREISFTGDVWAAREGMPVAPNTPILRVTAPVIQAQLAETALLCLINFPTLVATKANRIVRAAAGAPVVEFGLRRAHGQCAGLAGSRAAFIGGCSGTSNVDAARRYEIPVSGTQAHSWIMAFHSELEAFRAYAASFPENVTLLIDTYDVHQGARNAAIVAKELERSGHRLGAVRIDSGDLSSLSGDVRAILDQAGLDYVRIMGTSDQNEYSINELVESDAKMDGYGVGTELITGKPVAALSGVYKLVQIADRPVMKLSSNKVTYPGIKQVYRVIDDQGMYIEDVIMLEGEMVQKYLDCDSNVRGSIGDLEAVPLQRQVIFKGGRILPRQSIRRTKDYVADCVAKMPASAKKIVSPIPYSSRPSSRLIELMEDLKGLLTLQAKQPLCDSTTRPR